MLLMRDFKKYGVWEISHKFTLQIYALTNNFPSQETYGLSSQLRRASTSISTNISEGCGRDSDAEFSRFLTIAVGSASEVEYLILLSKDLNYLDLKTYEKLNEDINTIKRKIYSLKQKLN
ncbi:four helix bundle protein [Cellulophaga sp. Hel_I_12]|uniref:four helix bundle protein n=1 Tax=Cellulophaga sp. Hel_I_12 TaxID=1249972 RepID=UPI00350FE59D